MCCFETLVFIYLFPLSLEIENARLEATAAQQAGRIEILQKDLQNSVSVSHQ